MFIQGKFNKTRGLNQARKRSFSTATLNLNTNIVLTSTLEGEIRNDKTFKIVVNARAANPADSVLVDFTGNVNAIVATITPNDGTLNGNTVVDVTSAQLVEIINTDSAAGLNVTITDTGGLRKLQTATGGGTANGDKFANGGEGNNVTATFSGGSSNEFLLEDVGVSFDFEEVQAGEYLVTCVASTQVDGNLGSLNGKRFSLDSGNGVIDFTIRNDDEDPPGPNVIDVGDGTVAVGAVRDALRAGVNGNSNFFAIDEGDDAFKVFCAKTGLTNQEGLESNGADNSGFTITVAAEGKGNAGGVLNKVGVSLLTRNHTRSTDMTLADLEESEAGTIKFIAQTSGGTGVQKVTVASGDDQSFDAQNEQCSLIWLGHKWVELISFSGTDSNTSTAS